ncbi:MAG: DNA-binding protein [Roseibium sp.]
MRLWLTAQEIAELGLAGFPGSKRGVQKMIVREGWMETPKCRRRSGRDGGGGSEYHIDLFPLLIRKCLIDWGVPETIKTDNGSDFTARATVRLLDALGIEQELSSPYSPEQKGTVERVIGTFQRDCAATLPGFIGHSVADRKVIENRKAFSARLGTDDAKLFQVALTL